jgi:hypothetical protein
MRKLIVFVFAGSLDTCQQAGPQYTRFGNDVPLCMVSPMLNIRNHVHASETSYGR